MSAKNTPKLRRKSRKTSRREDTSFQYPQSNSCVEKGVYISETQKEADQKEQKQYVFSKDATLIAELRKQLKDYKQLV